MVPFLTRGSKITAEETSVVNKSCKAEASSPEIYLLFDGREDTAQAQGLSPGNGLVAADSAIQ